MEQNFPESQKDHSLPMVVPMRGDEDYVDDFAIDANEAMEYLGIKRSRLTQISGKELRVGRIRIDRYIRPVYRPKDLEDYKSWTRSTATHQSSTLAIEQALQRLEEQCSELERISKEELAQSIDDQMASQVARLSLRFAELRSMFEQKTMRLGQAFHSSAEQFSKKTAFFLEKIAKIEQRMDSVHANQNLHNQLVTDLHLDVRQLVANLSEFVKGYDQQSSQFAEQLEDFFEESKAQWQSIQLSILEAQKALEQRVSDEVADLLKQLRAQSRQIEQLDRDQKENDAIQKKAKQFVSPRISFRKAKRRPRRFKSSPLSY